MVARVRRCGERPHRMERTRNYYPLSMERGNESRHLIFWSLGTLTGVRYRARGLVE